MKLSITRDYKLLDDLETCCISADMLRSPATHLFISSNDWDSITVEICKELPDNALEYIQFLSPNKEVKLLDPLDDRLLKMLLALFPEKGGSIRRAYMSGKGMDEVIPVC